jgi:hypothetical protein
MLKNMGPQVAACRSRCESFNEALRAKLVSATEATTKAENDLYEARNMVKELRRQTDASKHESERSETSNVCARKVGLLRAEVDGVKNKIELSKAS